MSTGDTLYRTRVRSRGQITVPSEVRKALDISDGDDIIFYVDEMGKVCVQRSQIVPPDQAWFWTERWQKMEREAQTDIDAGRVHRFADAEAALAALESLRNADD